MSEPTYRESVAAMIQDNREEITELEEHTRKLEALYAWLTATDELTATDATDARKESEND